MKRDKEYHIAKLREMCVRDKGNSTVRTAAGALPFLEAYRFADVEHFVVLTLSAAHKVINVHDVSKGILNKTVIHPREVFRQAIMDNAAAVILAHNHPSGNTEPSSEDDGITKRLAQAGELLGITVLDHLILTQDQYMSYVDKGRMPS